MYFYWSHVVVVLEQSYAANTLHEANHYDVGRVFSLNSQQRFKHRITHMALIKQQTNWHYQDYKQHLSIT
jgi:hypothetical protein